MARSRLNKKVALLGSVALVVVVLAVTWIILRMSQNPEKFIKDGEKAFMAKDYKAAERNFLRARARAKQDSLRIEILFKLVNVFVEADKWNNVRGCWGEIIKIDPQNIKARYGSLKYSYIMANSIAPDRGSNSLWQELVSQTSDFLDIADSNMLDQEIAPFETFDVEEKPCRRFRPFLHLVRGRALLEMTKLGAVTNKEESITRAIADLEQAGKLDPNNVDVYWYLSQAAITKGDVLAEKGDVKEKENARQKAMELLTKAVSLAENNVKAHVNLLMVKHAFAQTKSVEEAKAMESEFLALTKKFNTSSEAFSALAGFYFQGGYQNYDKAIAAYEKAIELDSNNVNYAINVANIHYYKSGFYGLNEEMTGAVEMARNALNLPDAQDKAGPRSWAGRSNRFALYSLLAGCYIDQLLDDSQLKTDSQKQQLVTDAEDVVHQIEQLLGSGEDPQVVKWQGMLELAKGSKSDAIRKLYAAYELIKTSRPADRQDPMLSYTLAKVFIDTSEIGAAKEFFESALNSRIAQLKPGALLDYADLLMKLRIYNGVLAVADSYENLCKPNNRSIFLRVRAYIGAKQFDDAQKKLAETSLDDVNAVKLNAELVYAQIEQVRLSLAQKRFEDNRQGDSVDDKTVNQELENYNGTFVQLIDKLMTLDPNSVGVEAVAIVCDNLIENGKIENARQIVDRALINKADNATLLYYKEILAQPEQPDKITREKRKEIEEQVWTNASNPFRRGVGLGTFYQNNNEPNKAVIEFLKVLKLDPAAQQENKEENTNLRRIAAGFVFDSAIGTKDWQLAEMVANLAKTENMDECEGNFYAARLAAAKEQYTEALLLLDECLKKRPIFAFAYMIRAGVNSALGNERLAIEDSRKAASLNPLDGTIAKSFANVLYQRNQKLGSNVTAGQAIEVKDALRRAIALNPNDIQLQSFYAEFLSIENPIDALGIRQKLMKAYPNIENALLLGKLATKMALSEQDQQRKNALLNIASSAFEQASDIDPQNKDVVGSQAEYYRLTGQEKKAEELLAQSDDKNLLWQHYYRMGQFENAGNILKELYKNNPKNIDALKGLLVIAEKTLDFEGAKKYSDALVLLEDNVDNRLFQIQTFLRLGLVKEAENKLAGIKEKFQDEPRIQLLESWLAMKQGQLKKALELANQHLESGKGHTEAWRLRGEISLLLGNYEQAITDLKKSKSLSDEPAVKISLAKAYLGAARHEDAVTELKGIIDDPQTPIDARLLLEQVYLQLGKKDTLKKFYNDTIKLFGDGFYWYARAGAFALDENDFAAAEKYYEQAWQKSNVKGTGQPTVFAGYLQAILMAKPDKAIEVAQKYIDTDFAPVAYLKMGEAKIKQADKITAAQYFKKAVDKAGTNSILASDILQKMYQLFGPEEVQNYCRQKLDENPDSLAANLVMFNFSKINGEYNKSLDYIDKCLKIAGPQSPQAIDYVADKVAVLQMAYTRTSDSTYLRKAISEYESLLVKMPNNTSVLNNLAYMLAENNEKLNDALNYIQTAYQFMPNNPGLLDTYAYVLYKNDKFELADEFVQSALQQYEISRIPIPADVFEHMGLIKEKLGQTAQALEAYKKALETGAKELSKTSLERLKTAVERVLK